MTEDKLLTEIANYLTKQFICDPKELPDDECQGEAKLILAKIREKIAGAGLTDEDKERLWKQAQKEGSNPMCEFTPDELMTELIIEAQLQAVLNVLEEK